LFGIPVAAVLATTLSFYQLAAAEREQRMIQLVRPIESEEPEASTDPTEPARSGAGPS
jgi:hypothetical protein